MSPKKILLCYGSRYGSTHFISKDIEQYLVEKGATVDLVDLKRSKMKPDITQYDLIIVGSSIAIFMWVRKVKKFLKKLRNSPVPLVVFISCGMAIEEPERARERFLNRTIKKIGVNPVIAEPIAPILNFGVDAYISPAAQGRIKETIKAMVKEKYNETGVMDMRDMDHYNEFLQKIANLL